MGTVLQNVWLFCSEIDPTWSHSHPLLFYLYARPHLLWAGLAQCLMGEEYMLFPACLGDQMVLRVEPSPFLSKCTPVLTLSHSTPSAFVVEEMEAELNHLIKFNMHWNLFFKPHPGVANKWHVLVSLCQVLKCQEKLAWNILTEPTAFYFKNRSVWGPSFPPPSLPPSLLPSCCFLGYTNGALYSCLCNQVADLHSWWCLGDQNLDRLHARHTYSLLCYLNIYDFA